MAETGNSIREKESDVGKEVMYGRASGEQIPNRHDDDQSVETSQMGNGLGETEAVSDGALAEPMKNRDNKSVDEAAETGNSIRENESDVGKEVVSGGASGEQIPNLHDDDQSVHETSQMGNGLGETEGVSDGALCEPIKNRDDNKSVYEIAETGNNIGEKELDVGKEVVYGGASGEQIPNPNDYDQSLDENSQMGNGLGETEAVYDDALAEPMKNRDNKSVDEAAETGNSIRENESDVRKEVVFGGASGEQIPNLHDDDQSVHETSQMGNRVEETEAVLIAHYVNQSKIVIITRMFMKLQKQEIVLVKKSWMSEKKLCMVGHQVNKSQIRMIMTKVLMKPHKWEMFFVKQKRCLMAH